MINRNCKSKVIISSSGYTIVEVVTTIVLTLIIIIPMCMGYLTVVRLWSNYSQQNSSDSMVWLIYNKINVLFRDNSRLMQPEPAKWVFINSENDSTLLENVNDTLQFNKKPLNIDGHIKDFKVTKSNRFGKNPVWETNCTLVYKKRSSSLKWNSVFMENSIPSSLPFSINNVKDSTEFYWD